MSVRLDAGALVGFERNHRRVVGMVARSLHHGEALVVLAGVVARCGATEHAKRFSSGFSIRRVGDVVALDDSAARRRPDHRPGMFTGCRCGGESR